MDSDPELEAARLKETKLWLKHSAEIGSSKALAWNHPWVLAAQAYCDLIKQRRKPQARA